MVEVNVFGAEYTLVINVTLKDGSVVTLEVVSKNGNLSVEVTEIVDPDGKRVLTTFQEHQGIAGQAPLPATERAFSSSQELENWLRNAAAAGVRIVNEHHTGSVASCRSEIDSDGRVTVTCSAN